jgi:hypothetical protein
MVRGRTPASRQYKSKAVQKSTSAAEAEADTGKPLWSRLVVASSPSAKGKAKKDMVSTENQKLTWKALKANVKIPGLTPEEVKNLVNDKGEELFKRMMDDRERRDLGCDDAPVWGKLYYDGLKGEFAPSNTPTKKLKVNDESEIIEEELILSLQDLQGVSKSYDRVNNRLRMGPKLNQASYTLLAHQALKANPASDQDACTFLVNIISFSGRTRANAEHADTWSVMLPHLDESLKESFLYCRSARKPMDIWWAAKKSFAGLITPVADVDKCMAVLAVFLASSRSCTGSCSPRLVPPCLGQL